RAGQLVSALTRVAEQLEKNSNLRAQILKKLAYPAVLVGTGSIAVTFMLMFVIPVFEHTYRESKVHLSRIAQSLIAVSQFLLAYCWIVLVVGAASAIAITRARRKPEVAFAMDRWFLRLRLLGPWLRDLAVLQFVDVLNNLLESGF